MRIIIVIPFPKTLMTVVDITILLLEQFTLVPFSSLVILSIIINDVRGEVEVLEN